MVIKNKFFDFEWSRSEAKCLQNLFSVPHSVECESAANQIIYINIIHSH